MKKIKIKPSYFYFFIFIFLFSFVFKSLLLNIKTNLLDWGDPAFVVWQINQTVKKIKTLNFFNFFETNAFYPNKLTLLFADIFLPQALIATPISFFTNNPVLVFNIVFIITFILNYISSFLFWRQIFKKDTVGFLGALFTVFSPFFHLQLGHFQMISFWPFFFSLYFIYKNKEEKKVKNLILAGIFLSLQFLTSVYLSIFLAFSIFLFYAIDFIFSKRKINALKDLIIIFTVFFILDGIFIKGYLDVKKLYNIKRDIHEYILYSAHLSDYLFTTPINSLIHKSKIINRWNKFDKHVIGEKVAFPGFTLFILSLAGFLAIKTKKGGIFISAQISKENLFFLALIIFGFWFSLGPRLNFNGNYAEIPTGYNLLLKYIAPLESIRALDRWSFLFYLGINYFSIKALKKLLVNNTKKKRTAMLSIICIFFTLEYIPFKIITYKKTYITPFYRKVKTECQQKKKILLEYPVTHFNVKGGIFSGLEYISKVLLASSYHKCYLINGYSGYDPMYLRQLHWSLSTEAREKDAEGVEKLIRKYQVDFVKINTDKVIDPKVVEGWYEVKNKIKDAKIYIENPRDD